ncbi:MAG: hypothetical protein PVI46_09585, partial [Lysobacterales bacterium]
MPGLRRPAARQPIKDQVLEARQFTNRSITAFLLMLGAVLLLSARYVYLQVVSYDEFATRSTNNRVRVVPVA